MNLKFKQLHEAAQLPTRANPTDSGMDLYAVTDTVLLPGVPTLVQTGLAVELPPPQEYMLEYSETPQQYETTKYGSAIDLLPITFEAQIRPRSGLALKHGIQVLNSPGTLDNSYRGEIGVILLWGGHAANAWHITKDDYSEHRFVLKEEIGEYEHPGVELALNGWHFEAGEFYKIRRGDRIAQLVIALVVLCGAEWASELGATDRGEAGFGSTGK